MKGRGREQRAPRTWRLLGADGRPFDSPRPGTLGGHRRSRIYGRLDCPSALRAVARGGYARHRVFFADEAAAVAAGYRPCAVCLPERHREWRRGQPAAPRAARSSTARRTAASSRAPGA